MKKLLLTATMIMGLASVGMAETWNGPYSGVVYGQADSPEFSIDPNQVGVFGGHRKHYGDFVVGIEADAKKLDGLETYTTKGQVGYAYKDILVYGTAGYIKASYESETIEDIVYGVGVDYLFLPNQFVGVEYLETDTKGDASQLLFRVGYRF